MANAVLTTKVNPTYDDIPEERYHFPRTYLRQIEAARGDWIVYYEPRRTGADPSSRGGRQAYFATARIRDVIPDPTTPEHFYALIDSYLEFARSVPFKEGGHYYESALQRDDGDTNRGAFGRAVRVIPRHEYEAIISAAFAPLLVPGRPNVTLTGLAEDQEVFDRPIVERVVARPFRDAAFATAVKAAYEDTCAVSGLKIVNGGGRSEVQAAHIRPIAAGGPDSVRNGLALSSTVHWMFDRGLITIDDDLNIVVAERLVPEAAARLINPERRLFAPRRHEFMPHPVFLRWHRENVFRG